MMPSGMPSRAASSTRRRKALSAATPAPATRKRSSSASPAESAIGWFPGPSRTMRSSITWPVTLYSSDVSFLVNRQDDIGDAIINSGESDCILKIPFNDECLQQLIDKTDARIYLSNGIIEQNKPELLHFLDVHYNRFYKRESGFSKLINQRKTD